jgi:protein-S-isoprenylcysteine O-methyltransferase Ste14
MSSAAERGNMSTTLVIVLRAASLVAFAAAPLLLHECRGVPKPRAGQTRRNHAPVIANLTAFGLFFPTLLIFPGPLKGYSAPLFALMGCLLAIVGAALVHRSRKELGSAWGLVPMADEATGVVTTGPYRLVRHPIYLGLSVLALGQALAFASWPAVLVVLAGIVPTFAWRAFAEEQLLAATFGDRYALYRKQTRMIIPHLL